MTRRLIITALLLASAIGLGAEAGPEPGVEYLIEKIDVQMQSSFGTERADASSSTVMTVQLRVIHADRDRAYRFLAIQITGWGSDGERRTLSPYGHESDLKRAERPLPDRRDVALRTVWFDQPLAAGKERRVTLRVPTNLSIMAEVKSLSFRTHASGTKAEEACALLADPLLTADQRAEMATRLSKARGRRHRYLDDQGAWVVPAGLDASLPAATDREQASLTLRDAGETRGLAVIRFKNNAQRVVYLGLAGQGAPTWHRVNPRFLLSMTRPAGLTAITLWDGAYTTEIAVIKPGRTHVVSLK